MQRVRGPPDLDAAPGPVHDDEPADALRRAHRGDAPRPAGLREPGRALGGGAAPARRGRHHRRGRAAPHAVPALGRHVPAGRARRRARARPRAADRRRAFDGARRHDPGRDHDAPEAGAGRARHEPDPDHPRPSPGLLHLRPRLRALRGLAARGRRRAERRDATRTIPTRSACCSPSRRRNGGCRG